MAEDYGEKFGKLEERRKTGLMGRIVVAVHESFVASP
jgi:hypothetical protein